MNFKLRLTLFFTLSFIKAKIQFSTLKHKKKKFANLKKPLAR